MTIFSHFETDTLGDACRNRFTGERNPKQNE